MAKQSLFGSGKNAIQQTAHIRSTKVPGGNQGFSTGSLGGDTVPGPNGGAPLSSAKRQEVTSTKIEADGMNPYNRFEGDSAGVLGANVKGQDGGRTTDSPVPERAEMPNLGIKTKAAESASKSGDDTFPSDGVMHR
jgi:hypothetical protein